MAIAERNYGGVQFGAIGRKLPRKKKRTHTEKKGKNLELRSKCKRENAKSPGK